MNRPSEELLKKFAPIEIWEAAEAQASRSPHKRHRTGAIIYNPLSDTICSSGCSHTHAGGLKTLSVHAEQHAISRLHESIPFSRCVIDTLTRCDNYASCSRPCRGCAYALAKTCRRVIYAEICNDGSWSISSNIVLDLLTGYELKETRKTKDSW